MDHEQLWKEYYSLRGTTDTAHQIEVLQRCIDESREDILRYCAGRDLGMLYIQGPASVVDKEKAIDCLQDAAFLAMIHGYEHPDQYDEIACQTLAQLLYAEGDLRAFSDFKEALKLGSVIAARTMYRELNERPEKDSFDKLVKSKIRENIAALYSECIEAINEPGNAAAAMGVPQFALALVGLYELGSEVGIDRKKGLDWLNDSQKRGNGHAESVIQNPELQDPRRFDEFVQKMQSGTQQQPAQKKKSPQPKKKKKVPIRLIAVVVVLVIAWLARKWIVSLIGNIPGALLGVIAVAFLLVCLYIYSEDDSPSSSTNNSWAKPDNSYMYDFPAHLQDYDGNVWYLQYKNAESATYYATHTNETRTFWVYDFENGLPSGIYRKW